MLAICYDNAIVETLFKTIKSELIWRTGFVTLLKIGRGFVGIRSNDHAVATTSRHVCIAETRKARCVLAETRWRWTLNVL